MIFNYQEVSNAFVAELCYVKQKIASKYSDTLNDKHKIVYEYIKLHPGIQRQELNDKLIIPYGSLIRYIDYLQKNNLIERRGSKKTGGYWIVEGSSK